MGLLLPTPLVGEGGRSSGEGYIKMENKVHQKSVFVQFGLVNFRPFKIDKGWIASDFRPRNDEKHFRANYSLKYINTFLINKKEVRTKVQPLFIWWAGVDSNHRTLAGTDLQSVAFSHSATYPYLIVS